MSLYREALDQAIHWADESENPNSDRAEASHFAELAQAWAVIAVAARLGDQ